jgi:hypothetical protein
MYLSIETFFLIVQIGIEIKKWTSIDSFSPDTGLNPMFIIPKWF